MHFQITEYPHVGVLDGKSSFMWSLEKADGPVAVSPSEFDTEKEARSQIAAAKKSMRAAGRCKVLSPGEELPS